MLGKFQFHNRYLAGLALASTVLLAACGGGGSGGRDPILGGGGTAVLIPQVAAVTPAENAIGVSVNTAVITAAFNKSMDPASITTSTFTLACPAAIAAAVTYTVAGNLARMTLNSSLPANRTCTATVTTGARDDTGNPLAANYVWSFTTGGTPDAIPPTVSSTAPLLNATAVPANSRVTASFSEALDPLTVTGAAFSLVCPTGTTIAGAVAYSIPGSILTFTPAQNLPFSTACRATITTGIRDVAGNAMAAPFTWTFTTSAAPDTTPPTVLSRLPLSGATLVPLNSQITATFSEAMNPLSIVAANFTVECPASTPITGTVGYAVNGNIATFTPIANLPSSTVCRATVTTGVSDLAGLAMVVNDTWNFTTGPVADTTPPTVSTTVPTANATNVAFNTLVTASFSEAMNPLTITTANFAVACPATTPVVGVVGYVANGNVAVFTPTSPLPASTICRATLTTGVRDVAGNALATAYTWNFTTGVGPDTTRPQVTLTVPTSNQSGVAFNSLVTAQFSEPMNPLTVTPPGTFSLACPVGSPKSGVVSYAVNSNVATLTPTTALPASTTCRATITTAVTDVAGNAMASPFTWDFTTGAAADVLAPTVTLVVPAELATGVATNTTVNATFSEAMDPLTISTTSFTLQGAGLLPGQVNYDVNSRIATFTPSSLLATGTTYTATVTNTVRDLAGNAMQNAKVWTFSTGTGLAPGAVSLGAASTYGIMATAAVTSTGPSQINGDLSLAPGTSQGIPPSQVSGTIHVNDAFAASARADLLTAYNNLKALPAGITVLGGTNLGATFPGPAGIAPGTYTSGSTMLVSTPLTLNGGGNANAVWVFQIGSSLTTTASMVLTNGAQAKNIFWVPTSDVTIGVGTTFFGNVVAGRDSTAQTGVVVNGRILTGAITAGTIALDSTTVNVPAP